MTTKFSATAYKWKWSKLILLSIGLCFYNYAHSQTTTLNLSLNDVIETAYSQSTSAVVARHNLRAEYWDFRSFKAKYLPSLNLNGTLASYNRSLVALQNSQTGEIKYIQNNNLQNIMSLSVNQNVALTGGTLSVYTNLNRIDQFSPSRSTLYNSQPINITYLQPIRGYNAMKWERKISPKEYELAKKTYLESMENVTINATHYYFNLLLAGLQLELAEKNIVNTEAMYSIALKRFDLGSVQKDDLQQLELRLYNDRLSINKNKLAVEKAMSDIRSYLGLNDNVDINLILPDGVPDITIDFETVLNLSRENSSFTLENDISLLRAQEQVAQSKAERGMDILVRGQFGLTQQGNTLANAYRGPMDQEIVSVGISVPILDWGKGRGRLRMARSLEEVIKTQVEQRWTEHRQGIMVNVMEFNNQKYQCDVAARAKQVAEERYESTMRRFANGTVGVIDLNTAQSEKDDAVIRHIQEIYNYWNSYFNIRKTSLFDFITQTNISAEFDSIINN